MRYLIRFLLLLIFLFVAIQTHFYQVRTHSGQRLAEARRYKGALRELRQATRVSKHGSYNRYFYGKVMYDMKRYRGAAAIFRGLKRDYPAFVLTNYFLGASYMAQGQLARSIPYFSLQYRIDPLFSPNLEKLTYALAQEKRLMTAHYFIHRALLLNKKNKTALNYMGNINVLMGKLDAAEYYFQKLCVLAPRNVSNLSNLGLVYLKKGDKKSARSYFERALHIDPQNQNAQNGLAQCIE